MTLQHRQISSSRVSERITNLKQFKELVNVVLNTNETRSEMVKNYLKNVSNILATMSAAPTQSAITCSKLTLETLEQGMKYDQS